MEREVDDDKPRVSKPTKTARVKPAMMVDELSTRQAEEHLVQGVAKSAGRSRKGQLPMAEENGKGEGLRRVCNSSTPFVPRTRFKVTSGSRENHRSATIQQTAPDS